MVKVQGSDEAVAKNVFTLGGCTPIVDAHVITNETEDELLWEVWVECCVGFSVTSVILLRTRGTNCLSSFGDDACLLPTCYLYGVVGSIHCLTMWLSSGVS